MLRPEPSCRPEEVAGVLYQSSGCESRHGRPTGAPCSRLRATSERAASERSVESPAGAEWSLARGASLRAQCEMCESLQPREIGTRKGEWPSPSFRGEGNRLRLCTGGAQDAPGVGKRARREGLVRNWGGPPRRPTSGEGGGYKPSVKSRRVERESEGPIVAAKAVKAAGAKGPCFGRACVRG